MRGADWGGRHFQNNKKLIMQVNPTIEYQHDGHMSQKPQPTHLLKCTALIFRYTLYANKRHAHDLR